jgi:ketosteroid isomerase-like protein
MRENEGYVNSAGFRWAKGLRDTARAMSQENVRAARLAYEHPKDGRVLSIYDAEIEWDMTNYTGWLDQQIYSGPEGVRAFMRTWLRSFDNWEPSPERFIEAGNDVVVVVSDRAYVKGSSVPVTRRYAHVFTFRNGLVVRSRIYSDPAEALEAVGLSEQDAQGLSHDALADS